MEDNSSFLNSKQQHLEGQIQEILLLDHINWTISYNIQSKVLEQIHRMRINCKPEITIITLKTKNKVKIEVK